jgi:16S rRNA pseudouridine516 synthase
VARLDVLLARNLGWSRAAARDAVGERRVQSEGTALDPRMDVPASRLPLPITVDGQPATLWDAYHLMLNKPVGSVTALFDARYPTAYALLRDAPLFDELRPAGRLDLESAGLLIWTTDGTWLHRLTHPKRAVPRTYHAALARPFRAAPAGLTLEDGHRPVIQALAPLPPEQAHPALGQPADTAAFATITIIGGAYHEVRRIFAALGSHVLALCRVSFGRLALPPDLPPGAYRPIVPDEV